MTHYEKYIAKLDEISKSENLIEMGLKNEIVDWTYYGYPIQLLSVGYGSNDLFVVGGTHSSEIITVDYVVKLIENISNMDGFDPNLFTIKFIPSLNPEGFDIVTSCLSNITKKKFTEASYEYYLRYRLDNLIIKAIREFKDNRLDNATFFNSNKAWLNLRKGIGKFFVSDFEQKLINYIDVYGIEKALEVVRFEIKDKYSRSYGLKSKAMCNLMDTLSDGNLTNPKVLRMHQEMFKDCLPDNLWSSDLEKRIKEVYSDYLNPKGSIVTHDSNGSCINLNGNCVISPGINFAKSRIVKHGNSPRSNVRNYYFGPLGVSCLDYNNFEYAEENKCLLRLINESVNKNRYFATILYHGTGGMLYYLPSEYGMANNANSYSDFCSFNERLANSYAYKSDYKILSCDEYKGFGDYLRAMYPGVLLIELSKMGGNPIAPYGDRNNINRVYMDNNAAFNDLLKEATKIKDRPLIRIKEK